MANKGKWKKRKKPQLLHEAAKRKHLARIAMKMTRAADKFGTGRCSREDEIDPSDIGEEDLEASDRPAFDPTGRQ